MQKQAGGVGRYCVTPDEYKTLQTLPHSVNFTNYQTFLTAGAKLGQEFHCPELTSFLKSGLE